MSSMVRTSIIALAAAASLAAPATAFAQSAADWDRARANLVAEGPGRMAPQIERWERLWADTSAQLSFGTYANFLLQNPGFPDEATLRARAERRLREEFVDPQMLLAFFADHDPVTNPARAHYAIALMGSDRARSQEWATRAWRGGEMSQTAEAALFATYGGMFSQDDNDSRMDALLWQREPDQAERQLTRVSPSKRERKRGRLGGLR